MSSLGHQAVIMNNVRGDFNYDFSNVSPVQLLAKIYYECDQNLAGPANMRCHQIAKDNLMLIYSDLQAGRGAYYICQQLNLC
ncbi:surfactant protein B [Cooperia oncophora]